MKRISIILFSLFIIFSANAQEDPIDFEPMGNGASWNWTVFENDTNPDLEIVANPDPSAINNSSMVAKFTALQTGQPFAGCETLHGGGVGTFTINTTNDIIKIMVWKSVISDVGIKLVDATSWSLGEIKVANTLVNQWEELTFDFSSHHGTEYDQLVIFPDFNARSSDNIIYFDNVTFSPVQSLPVPMTAAPDPTSPSSNVISMFSNVYTDVPVDSWNTAWSSANYSEVQIVGNDTKKYENLDFNGIETIEANLIDASSMLYLHMDVWTPNMTTFRIKLVDFGADKAYAGGDDTEHEVVFDNHAQENWVSYKIPLTDFTSLGATNNLAQLIISGLPVGTGTIYIDNVYFSNMTSNLDELTIHDFKLFPNPTDQRLTIASDRNIQQIKIYNTLGEIVVSELITNKNLTLDLKHLPNGIYLVEVMINKEIIAKQFSKID